MPGSVPDGPVNSPGRFVTSRPFSLPTSEQEMVSRIWYNLWKTQQWPYRELHEGDTLYFFDTTEQAIVWKSRVCTTDRFEYESKEAVRQRIQELRFQNALGLADLANTYFDAASEYGYFLAFRRRTLSRIVGLNRTTSRTVFYFGQTFTRCSTWNSLGLTRSAWSSSWGQH